MALKGDGRVRFLSFCFPLFLHTRPVVTRAQLIFNNMSDNENSAFDILLKRNVPHILEKIFLSLDYESFKKSLKVSRAWSQMLGTKSFLKRAKSVYAKGIRSDKKKIIEALLSGDAAAASILLSGLISMGVNIDFSNACVTPLHRACEKGLKDVVKLLLSAGANPNKSIRQYELNPYSTQYGNKYNNTNVTPLHYAANGGHLDVVNLLLGAGANPNKSDETPLNGAAHKGHFEIVGALLAAGADPNKENAGDNPKVSFKTPLNGAANQGHLEIVRALLAAGADPNRVNAGNETPLSAAAYLAAYRGHLELSRIHLAAGEYPNMVAKLPYTIEEDYTCPECDFATGSRETMKQHWDQKHQNQIGKGQSQTGQSQSGNSQSPTERSVLKPLTRIPKSSGFGHKCSLCPYTIGTPLDCAADAGHLDVVKLLLGAGASPTNLNNSLNCRLVPVQITIPAQPGNPTSQPRQLTVQVPAHALQQSGQTAAILQNVLTQARIYHL